MKTKEKIEEEKSIYKITISDIFCTWEYNFYNETGEYSIDDIVKCLTKNLNLKELEQPKLLFTTNFNH